MRTYPISMRPECVSLWEEVSFQGSPDYQLYIYTHLPMQHALDGGHTSLGATQDNSSAKLLQVSMLREEERAVLASHLEHAEEVAMALVYENGSSQLREFVDNKVIVLGDFECE